MPTKKTNKVRKNKKSRKPNVFVGTVPKESTRDNQNEADITDNQPKSKIRPTNLKIGHPTKTRTQVYTKTQTKELKKIGAMSGGVFLILIVLAIIL